MLKGWKSLAIIFVISSSILHCVSGVKPGVANMYWQSVVCLVSLSLCPAVEVLSSHVEVLADTEDDGGAVSSVSLWFCISESGFCLSVSIRIVRCCVFKWQCNLFVDLDFALPFVSKEKCCFTFSLRHSLCSCWAISTLSQTSLSPPQGASPTRAWVAMCTLTILLCFHRLHRHYIFRPPLPPYIWGHWKTLNVLSR